MIVCQNCIASCADIACIEVSSHISPAQVTLTEIVYKRDEGRSSVWGEWDMDTRIYHFVIADEVFLEHSLAFGFGIDLRKVRTVSSSLTVANSEHAHRIAVRTGEEPLEGGHERHSDSQSSSERSSGDLRSAGGSRTRRRLAENPITDGHLAYPMKVGQ
jgi:hypothetical protein